VASNLVQRVAVSAIFGPALLALFWFGGTPLLLLVVVITALGALDFCDLQNLRRLPTSRAATVILCALWCVVVSVQGIVDPRFLWLGFAAALPGLLPVSAVTPLAGIRLTIRGFGYVGFLGGFALLVRETSGPVLTLLVLAGIWITDSGAYFSGRRFGRRHPFPRLSPGKTVAGFVGGMLAALATGAAGCLIVEGMGYGVALGLGAVIGIGSLAGDLAESKLKRDAGAKDTSTLIPGHGGVLDRFDSFLFVFPMVYLYLLLV